MAAITNYGAWRFLFCGDREDPKVDSLFIDLI